jgi:tetratricopeptide (TPR) repeat protein
MKGVAAAVLVVAISLSASTVAAQGDLGAGDVAFQQGDFEVAIQQYERELSRGVNHETVYYNLGNAYFRTGQMGRAIYNYERALRLQPALDDARYNLQVAREVVAESHRDRLKGAEADPVWIRLVTHYDIGELSVGVLALNLLFFVMLLVLRFLAIGIRRTILIVMSLFSALALVCVLALFGDQAVLREGTDEGFAERGQLHAGLRVRVIETKAGWYRVRLSNGVEGWVQKPHVGSL